jgi:peptidoglycan/LPS O-acetylase OafA/YrhL
MSNVNHLTRYAYLDGWRGLSILAVLIGHFLNIHGFNAGRFGVEMFFVLSGRLMAEILFIKHTPLPSFFKRRISRVWPALFVFIIAMWVIFGRTETDLHVGYQSVLATLTFTYNYYSIYVSHTPVLDHIWSLCIEEHTYILLALIAFLSRKYQFDPTKPLIALCLIFLANGALLTFGQHLDYYNVYWRSDTRSASILIGVISFLLFNHSDKKVHPLTSIALLALAIAFNLNPIPDPVKYSLGTICVAIAICTIKELPDYLMKFLCHPWLTRIGLISFSLYLWQQPCYKMIHQGHPRVFLLAAALIIAAFSYHFIEVPVRKFLNELGAKSKA